MSLRAIGLTCAGLLFMLGAALGGLCVSCAADEGQANLYPLAGVVVRIDSDSDLVSVRDGAGNLWQFYGVEGWMLGEGVAILMDGRGTEVVSDDRMLSVRHANLGVANVR